MSPSIAILVYAIGIAGLFYLDRDSSVSTSKALWLPVMWLWILGSRPVSVWLSGSQVQIQAADTQLDGSPVDRFVFMVLLVAAIAVLIFRGQRIIGLLKANWPILFFGTFCLLSVMWSDFPDVAFKRCFKAMGDIVMVLVVVTDTDLQGAFKRVLSRVGFILLPVSVLLIKYFLVLGSDYDPWIGTRFNTGVTTNKNTLGAIVFVVSLGALWRVIALLQSKGQPNRGRHMLAQIALLAIGIYLLSTADSATSLACFGLGAMLMFATNLKITKRYPGTVHAIILLTFLIAGLAVASGVWADIVHAMGRKTDLTGRTEIWDVILRVVPNWVVGAGFESFWLGKRLEQVRSAFPNNPLNEAHNGYLEIYINLGVVGLTLLGLILINGYRNAAATLRRDPAFGGLLLAYVVTAANYGITEAGFRMLNPVWFFLVFAVVAGSTSVLAVKHERQQSLVEPERSYARA